MHVYLGWWINGAYYKDIINSFEANIILRLSMLMARSTKLPLIHLNPTLSHVYLGWWID